MVPFLYIIRFILVFQVILDNISFMKIKIFKPKHQNLNSKLNGLHLVEFIQNTFNSKWKSSVLSPKIVYQCCN